MFLAVVAGCSGPAEIDTVGQYTLYDRRDVLADAAVRDERGRLLPDLVALPVQSSDPSVVALGEGSFACVSSGTATVTLAADELSKAVEVRCSLVERIEVSPTELEVILDLVDGILEPVELEALRVEVLDESGTATDVPVHVRSGNTNVVSVGPNDVLEFNNPGRTSLTVSAGDTVVEVPIIVGEVISSEAVAVNEASVSTIDIRPGTWRWSVRADEPIGLAVEGCDVQEVGPELSGGCALPDGGRLVLTNSDEGLRRVAVRMVRMPDA